MQSAPDDELCHRLRTGDTEALRALYMRYASLVFTAAARIVSTHRAEDVVQEVFLALWQKREAFDPQRGSFRAWIVTIARNRALNERRRDRSHAEVGDAALDDVPADVLEPDEARWAERRRTAVRNAVAALPDTQRRALSLAFLDELTHDEVAATLGAPLGTAKTRIRSALRRLAPILAAVVAAIAVVVAWRRDNREERDHRALEMVTSSDVVPRRLEAVLGVPPDAHGQFRARPGSRTVVLTTTKLPSLANGERYVAWTRYGATWISIGVIDRGHEPRALLVAENERFATPPDELRVTRETTMHAAPSDATVVLWRAL